MPKRLPSVPPSATAAAPTDALRVVAQDAPAASPAARAYRLQWKRIGQIRGQLEQMEVLALAHRRALVAQVFPLRQRQQTLNKTLALWLDQQLAADDTLSGAQRQWGAQVVCQLARELVAQGHADMAVVHDRHSPRTLDQMECDHARAIQAQLEALLGEPLLPDQPDADLNDVMRAARARMQQAAREDEAKAARRQAKRNARREARQQAQTQAHTAGATGQVPPGAQGQPTRVQDDASARLRALYRQLASALHPDRESDPEARHRKTALMSEANAAYDRKDYVTLVDIQQRAALAEPAEVETLSDARLAALTLLVKTQVAELERQRARQQQALLQEFGVPPGVGLNSNTLKTLLNRQEDELLSAVAAAQREWDGLQQPGGLKRWLKQQRSLARQAGADVPLPGGWPGATGP